MTRGPDPTAPLWRTAQAFRLLSCLYALGFQTAINSDLRHPATAWVLFGVLMAWSAACAVAYLRGFGRRPSWVIAEIIVVVLLMWSNKVVASPQWAADNQTWPTTLWATNPTISAALQFGPVGGMLTGLVVMATNFAVKNYLTLNLGHNATIIIELSIGLAIGMAARTADTHTTSCNERRNYPPPWRNASACPGKFMTVSSRCSRWWPNGVTKSALPHPVWRTWRANRNASYDDGCRPPPLTTTPIGPSTYAAFCAAASPTACP